MVGDPVFAAVGRAEERVVARPVDPGLVVAGEDRLGVLFPGRGVHRVGVGGDGEHAESVVGRVGRTGRVDEEDRPLVSLPERDGPLADVLAAKAVDVEINAGADQGPGVLHPGDVEPLAAGAGSTTPNEVKFAVGHGQNRAVDRVIFVLGVGQELALERVGPHQVIALGFGDVHPMLGFPTIGGREIDVPARAGAAVKPVELGGPNVSVAAWVVVLVNHLVDGVPQFPDSLSLAEPDIGRGCRRQVIPAIVDHQPRVGAGRLLHRVAERRGLGRRRASLDGQRERREQRRAYEQRVKTRSSGHAIGLPFGSIWACLSWGREVRGYSKTALRSPISSREGAPPLFGAVFVGSLASGVGMGAFDCYH